MRFGGHPASRPPMGDSGRTAEGKPPFPAVLQGTCCQTEAKSGAKVGEGSRLVYPFVMLASALQRLLAFTRGQAPTPGPSRQGLKQQLLDLPPT